MLGCTDTDRRNRHHCSFSLDKDTTHGGRKSAQNRGLPRKSDGPSPLQMLLLGRNGNGEPPRIVQGGAAVCAKVRAINGLSDFGARMVRKWRKFRESIFAVQPSP